MIFVRRFALLVFLLFVAGIFSATADGMAHASVRADAMGDSDGPSCPDPADDGIPCGPTCPCACCPGHSMAVPFMLTEPAFRAPTSDDLELPLLTNLHPKDVPVRIFHPPRA
jgi:hypothetical protein